jgi:hypothetical protein
MKFVLFLVDVHQNIGIKRNHARRFEAGVSVLTMTCYASSCCQFAGSCITTALPPTLAFCSLKADLALTGESVITRRKSSSIKASYAVWLRCANALADLKSGSDISMLVFMRQPLCIMGAS